MRSVSQPSRAHPPDAALARHRIQTGTCSPLGSRRSSAELHVVSDPHGEQAAAGKPSAASVAWGPSEVASRKRDARQVALNGRGHCQHHPPAQTHHGRSPGKWAGRERPDPTSAGRAAAAARGDERNRMSQPSPQPILARSGALGCMWSVSVGHQQAGPACSVQGPMRRVKLSLPSPVPSGLQINAQNDRSPKLRSAELGICTHLLWDGRASEKGRHSAKATAPHPAGTPIDDAHDDRCRRRRLLPMAHARSKQSASARAGLFLAQLQAAFRLE